MPFSKVLNVVAFIDHSIKNESADNVKKIAEEIGISERHVFNYLKAMKNRGAPIEYCRKTHKFYYTEPGFFHIGFIKKDVKSKK